MIKSNMLGRKAKKTVDYSSSLQNSCNSCKWKRTPGQSQRNQIQIPRSSFFNDDKDDNYDEWTTRKKIVTLFMYICTIN